MRRRVLTVGMSAATGLALLWHTAETGGQPALETGPDAEVIADGLHRVVSSISGEVWVRPGVDLSRYTRIFFMPTSVHFREIPERRYSARAMANATEFPVSDSRQARLRELFGESLYEAVSGVRSYELTNELGRDVLMVHGLLTDVISGLPPENTTSLAGSVRWAWEANLVLVLRDSMSSEVLARTVERQRIGGPFDSSAVFGLTPRVVQDWSRWLARRLGELSDLYSSRLRRLQERSAE